MMHIIKVCHRIIVFYCLLSIFIQHHQQHHSSHAFTPRLFIDPRAGGATSVCIVQTGAFLPPEAASLYLRATTAGDIDGTSSKKKKKKKAVGKKATTKWIACSSTTEVTRAIERYVQDGDTVAELGSQLRESSIALCNAIGPTGKAVLVDMERKFPNNNEKKKKGNDNERRTSAMRREGDENDFYTDRATFVETNEFELWREALFFGRSKNTDKPQYDVLVVDVSNVAGNDLELTCISLVREFIALNKCNYSHNEDNNHSCRAVIIKSGSLHNLARRLYHAEKITSGSETLQERYHSSSMIVGAVGVRQYRETIPHVVRGGDVCIEVGCHLGTTTVLIDEAARDGRGSGDGDDGIRDGQNCGGGACIGVDVGPHIIKRARVKYPHISFEVGDGFKTGQLARMKERYFSDSDNKSGVYDVVYVDIGGLSGSEGLLEAVSLLASISNSLEPRCIVIKSLCMRRLASCLVPFSEVWRKERLAELATKNEETS